MKKNRILNNAMQEGVFFLLLSGGVLWYSLDAYSKSFVKDWTQSPSLFPLLGAALLALLGAIVLRQGIAQRAAEEAAADKAADKARTHPRQLLIVLGMALLYYLALVVVRLPYMGVTVSGLTFNFSTFELVTIVYLAAMMYYLGVRKVPVLVLAPVCSSAALSIIFRTMLRVLLP